MKMLNQLAIARIKKKLFAVYCLKKRKNNPNSSCPFESDCITQHENRNIFSPLQCYKSLISIHFRNHNQREVVTEQNSEEFININICTDHISES